MVELFPQSGFAGPTIFFYPFSLDLPRKSVSHLRFALKFGRVIGSIILGWLSRPIAEGRAPFGNIPFRWSPGCNRRKEQNKTKKKKNSFSAWASGRKELI